MGQAAVNSSYAALADQQNAVLTQVALESFPTPMTLTIVFPVLITIVLGLEEVGF